MDYRRFLKDAEVLELAWLGGGVVDAPGRRLRLTARPERPGWYRFSVKGRTATPKEPCDAPELSSLPKVRGWTLGDRLVREGAEAELLNLLPAEEPPRFSPVVARRWHSGELLFDSLEFETEAEGAVREALAAGQSLKEVKGVPAPLRAAFGYAALEAASRNLRIPFAPGEVRPQVARVADGGLAAADAVLRELEAERELTRRELAELERRRGELLARQELEAARAYARDRARLHDDELEAARQAAHQPRAGRRGGAHRQAGNPAERAEAMLEDAGAVLETTRRLGADQLEVVFRFMNHRFITIVDAHTMQVVDSGICLGHPPRDDLVTLDSLPSVIKEAIDTGRLVMLRHP